MTIYASADNPRFTESFDTKTEASSILALLGIFRPENSGDIIVPQPNDREQAAQTTIFITTSTSGEDAVVNNFADHNLENMNWLRLSEPSFAFWDNEEDAIYDDL